MPKQGQHHNDANDPAVSKGPNNPSKSVTITTGTPKKRETYEQQAAQHRGVVVRGGVLGDPPRFARRLVDPAQVVPLGAGGVVAGIAGHARLDAAEAPFRIYAPQQREQNARFDAHNRLVTLLHQD